MRSEVPGGVEQVYVVYAAGGCGGGGGDVALRPGSGLGLVAKEALDGGQRGSFLYLFVDETIFLKKN